MSGNTNNKPTYRIVTQQGGTCYGHATTRAMLNAWRRVECARPPSYNTLLDAIVERFGTEGADPQATIEFFGDPHRVKQELQAAPAGMQKAQALFADDAPFDYEQLPKLRVDSETDFEKLLPSLKSASKQLVVAFWMSKQSWTRFTRHFETQANVVLTKAHLVAPSGEVPDWGVGSGGHAVVVDCGLSSLDVLYMKNSWGTNWADGGQFQATIEALSIDRPVTLIDVWWYANDIGPLIQERFHQQKHSPVPRLLDDAVEIDFDSPIAPGVYHGRLDGGTPIVSKQVTLGKDRDLKFAFEHPNIVRTIGYSVPSRAAAKLAPHELPPDNTLVHVIMELAMGTLADVIDALSPHDRFWCVEQICRALAYLARQGIVHRDVKPANIFRFSNDVWKLGDFGISSNSATYKGTASGTRDWTDPKILSGTAKDIAVQDRPLLDMYSVGKLLASSRDHLGVQQLSDACMLDDVKVRPTAESVACQLKQRRKDAWRGEVFRKRDVLFAERNALLLYIENTLRSTTDSDALTLIQNASDCSSIDFNATEPQLPSNDIPTAASIVAECIEKMLPLLQKATTSCGKMQRKIVVVLANLNALRHQIIASGDAMAIKMIDRSAARRLAFVEAVFSPINNTELLLHVSMAASAESPAVGDWDQLERQICRLIEVSNVLKRTSVCEEDRASIDSIDSEWTAAAALTVVDCIERMRQLRGPKGETKVTASESGDRQYTLVLAELGSLAHLIEQFGGANDRACCDTIEFSPTQRGAEFLSQVSKDLPRAAVEECIHSMSLLQVSKDETKAAASPSREDGARLRVSAIVNALMCQIEEFVGAASEDAMSRFDTSDCAAGHHSINSTIETAFSSSQRAINEIKFRSQVAEGCIWVAALGSNVLRGLVKVRTHQVPRVCVNRLLAEEMLTAVGSLTHLQLLALNRITDAGLAEVAKLTQLQSLFLHDCKISDAGFAEVAKLTQLRTLNLIGFPQTTDAGLAYIARLNQLELLALSQVTDAGLAQVAKLTQLRSLFVRDYSKITDAGLAQIANLPQLLLLKLPRCTQITNAGLAEVAKLTQLQSLDLSHCYQITDVGLRHVAELTQLRTLNLTRCSQTTDAGLAEVAKLTQLQSQITDVGLRHVAQLTHLRSLDLTGCDQIMEAGLAHLAKLTHLSFLKLSFDAVWDLGLVHVAKLTQLQHLTLCGCDQITEAGLAHLPNLTQLLQLKLSRCDQITEAGLAHVAKLTQLQSLDLDISEISDVGFAHLANLTELLHLRLSSCRQITEAGVAHVAKLTQLQSFDLGTCKAAQCASVAKALPLCRVTQRFVFYSVSI